MSTILTALLAVDLNNDFTEGGNLAVTGGDAAARRTGAHIARTRGDHVAVFASLDHHIEPGDHFAAVGSDPDFTTNFPAHCVAGTEGAELDPELVAGARAAGLDVDDPFALFDAVVFKGQHAEAFSPFEGVTEPDGAGGVTLDELLRAARVERIDVAGIATELCVKAAVLDALVRGYRVRLLVDLCAGIDPAAAAAAIDELQVAGAEIVVPARPFV